MPIDLNTKTEAELMSALRKAHDAGDTAAAQRFADVIKAKRAAPSAEEAPSEEFDVAGFLEGTVNPRLQAFAQGASFGFADNISALVRNLDQFADQDLNGPDQRDFKQRFDDFWDTENLVAGDKAEREKFAAENPGEALIYELTGALMVPGAGNIKAVQAAAKGAGVAKGAAVGAGIGAAEGAVYGAGVADGDPMLESMARNAAFGLGGGAVLGGAAAKVGQVMKARKALKDETAAHAIVDAADEALLDARAIRPQGTASELMADAARRSGIDPTEVQNALKATGRKLEVPSKAKAQFVIEQKRLAQQGTTPSKWQEGQKAVAKGVDEIAGALSTRIKNIDQKTFNLLREHDFKVHAKTQDWLKEVAGFERLNKRRHKATKPVVKRLLLNNKFNEALDVMRATGDDELVRGAEAAQRMFERARKELGEVGYDVAADDQYFARVVKDVNGLRGTLGRQEQSVLDEAIKRYAQKQKKPVHKLTQREKDNVANNVLHTGKVGGKKAGQLGSTKARTVEHVGSAIEEQYHDPVEALTAYVTRAVEDIEERRMFGKHAKGGTSAIDVDETVGAYLNSRTDIPADKVDELTTLLTTRFGSGKEGPGKWTQRVKNIGLATALANPKSAAIQLADLGHSALFNGFKNTAAAMLRKNQIDVGDIGLDNIIQQEFSTMGKTAKNLDRALRATGFKAIDRFGKETFMNAALNKATAMTQSAKGRQRLEQKWAPVFEQEFPQLLDDLRNGKVTENVKLMLWHELSDVQPISLSEMPQKYLELKNGRIMYSLKSFALKQLDILRRGVYEEAKKGNKKGAINFAIAYATITGGATALTDEVRQALFTGGADPIELEPGDLPDKVLWHMLATTGVINQYNVEKSKGDIASILGNGIAPPLGMIGGVGGDVIKTMQGNPPESIAASGTMKSVPIVGSYIHGIWGDGFEKRRKRKLLEARGR